MASAKSLDHVFRMHLETRSITSSECISKLAQLQPPSASTNLLDYDLGEHISKLARSRPPSVSPNPLNYGLQVHLQTRSITILECLSKFTQPLPPSVSPNMFDYHLQVHLQTCSITASECISEFTRSSFSDAPRIAPKHRLQPVQIYHV